MAVASSENGAPPQLSQVTSPFLRAQRSSSSSEGRQFRQSLDMMERINFNDLEPFRTAADQTEAKFGRRQNRLSREILGVDDPMLSAPDNARSTSEDTARRTDVAEDEDTSSVAFGGSIASTVPDRYGFVGGSQYTSDIKYFEFMK